MFNETIERRDICKVRRVMHGLGYGPERIKEAVASIKLHGTAELTSAIDDEDRDAIEALLERHPDWNRPVWDVVHVGAA